MLYFIQVFFFFLNMRNFSVFILVIRTVRDLLFNFKFYSEISDFVINFIKNKYIWKFQKNIDFFHIADKIFRRLLEIVIYKI